MKKTRQSNVELLRLLAMFMVLLLHAVQSFQWPRGGFLMSQPLVVHLGFSFVEMISIVAVNVFVLISGWFGIHPTMRGLGKFLYQCAFCCLVVDAVLWAVGADKFGLLTLLKALLLSQTGWFVRSYLLLFLLSPVLNAFVQTADERTQRRVLIGLFLAQTIGAFVLKIFDDFNFGYSLLSFVCLYLLAQYVRRFQLQRLARLRSGFFLLVFVGIALLHVLIGSIALFGFGSKLFQQIMLYSSPLVVLQALALLLYFTRQTLSSTLVNRIAAGSFAVYLIHQHPGARPFYASICQKAFMDAPPALGAVALLLWLCVVYLVCVGVDELRRASWELLLSRRKAEKP